MLSQDKLPSFIASQNTSLKTPIVSSRNMSRKCDRGVDPEFRSDPELMSTDPLTMKGFEASADVGWPMNHVANRVSAGPSAMEVMADHWLRGSLAAVPEIVKVDLQRPAEHPKNSISKIKEIDKSDLLHHLGMPFSTVRDVGKVRSNEVEIIIHVVPILMLCIHLLGDQLIHVLLLMDSNVVSPVVISIVTILHQCVHIIVSEIESGAGAFTQGN